VLWLSRKRVQRYGLFLKQTNFLPTFYK